MVASDGHQGVIDAFRALFAARKPIIGVCASGILIRAVAPLLRDKHEEPPVIAVADDGSAVVPLLGGHRGANEIATRLANALGCSAAITTASDVRLGVALDAPPAGWRLENADHVKAATSALLDGAPAVLRGEADWLEPLATSPLPAPEGSDGSVSLDVEGAQPVIYRRADHAIGVGCSRHCPPEEMIALVDHTLTECGLAVANIASLHSVDVKADEPAIHALARHLGVEARFFTRDELRTVHAKLPTPSPTVEAAIGVPGVCEAAALLAASDTGRLVAKKRKSEHATCAIAHPAAMGRGQGRGRLSIIGIGPGDRQWRTPEASIALAAAEEVVGYQGYLDLLGTETADKRVAGYQLGEETERCRHALESAACGRHVVLVCSGDSGIYGMASLVLELIAEGRVSDGARRTELVVVPGLSAMQAAAARVGAPLGHDFCAISLSDLLTPRETILHRLQAAATGDFVTALYNPVSRRRQALLGEARRIMLGHRNPSTPVAIARNLGRAGEAVSITSLAELDSRRLDMLTILVIGSTTTRILELGSGERRLYTPRGYRALQESKQDGLTGAGEQA